MIVLISDRYVIKPGAFSIVQFFGLGSKDITNMNGFSEIDRCIQCDRQYISVITSKCKGTVR